MFVLTGSSRSASNTSHTRFATEVAARRRRELKMSPRAAGRRIWLQVGMEESAAEALSALVESVEEGCVPGEGGAPVAIFEAQEHLRFEQAAQVGAQVAQLRRLGGARCEEFVVQAVMIVSER